MALFTPEQQALILAESQRRGVGAAPPPGGLPGLFGSFAPNSPAPGSPTMISLGEGLDVPNNPAGLAFANEFAPPGAVPQGSAGGDDALTVEDPNLTGTVARRSPGLRNALLGLAAGIGGSIGKQGFGIGEGVRGFMRGGQIDAAENKAFQKQQAADALLADPTALGSLSPGMRAVVAADPDMAIKLASSLAAQKAKAAASQVRVETLPDGTKIQVDASGRRTSFPKSLAEQESLRRAGAANVSVNTAKPFGKVLTDGFTAARERAGAASGRLVNLQVLENQLEDPNLFTGKGAGVVNDLKAFARDFLGIEAEGTSSGEVAQRVSAEFGLQLKDELKLGRMSDGDRKFLLSLPPGIFLDRESNRRLISIRRAMDEQSLQEARIWNAATKGGQIDPRVFETIDASRAEFREGFGSVVKSLRDRTKQLTNNNPLAGIPIGQATRGQLRKYLAFKGGVDNLTPAEQEEALARLQALNEGQDGR